MVIVEWAISEFPWASVSKLGLVRSLRYGNIFHSHANKTHFHNKGCALGLILKVRVLELGSGLFKISVTLLKEGRMKYSKQRYVFLIFRCWINGSLWIYKGPILVILMVRYYHQHMYFNVPIIVRSV